LQLKELSHAPICNNCFKVSQEIVTFLNDDILIQQLYDLSKQFVGADLVILDLSAFPVFGILMAKKGCKVHCLMYNDADLEFLNYVCQKNLIIDNVDVLSDDAYNSLLSMANIYDIIYIDAVGPNGILNDKILGKYSEFKRLLKHSGTILPNEIVLNLQIVNSNYLDKCWKVDDANSFGFKIAEQINEYAVAELWELDYKSTPHEILSESIALWNIIQDESEKENTIEIIVNKNGVAHGVLYWFEINLNNSQPFDTRRSTYYKIASFLFTSPKYVTQDCILRLQTKQHRGLLKIDCVK
ncbi:uncharacterized protein LOC112904604, partial [Agrilus planipennis]|uniref:Uncharacterized protein LOC112904604 n=1 Tax=Agrilus planipennis TaxID=224129 RepID=A0A7F5R5B6_AGRPL